MNAHSTWSTLGPGQSVWEQRSAKRTSRLVDGFVGRILAGRYRLGRLVDDARLCGTYDALEIETGRNVAIELVSRPRDGGRPSAQRLRQEARRLVDARHPALRVVRTIGVEGSAPFIVSDPVEGETLAARLRRSGPLSTVESIGVALTVIDGLEVAHAAGIVHGNLKPEKIRLGVGPGAEPVATLMGLGVTSILATLRDVDTRAIGTPPYLAPEQIVGEGVDARTDVWGVGLLLFEMVSGRRAFDGASADEIARSIMRSGAPELRTVSPGVRRDLSCLVGAALARSLHERLSMRDLRRGLRAVLDQSRTSLPKPARTLVFDCSDPCDDLEATTDLHLCIETDLGAL